MLADNMIENDQFVSNYSPISVGAGHLFQCSFVDISISFCSVASNCCDVVLHAGEHTHIHTGTTQKHVLFRMWWIQHINTLIFAILFYFIQLALSLLALRLHARGLLFYHSITWVSGWNMEKCAIDSSTVSVCLVCFLLWFSLLCLMVAMLPTNSNVYHSITIMTIKFTFILFAFPLRWGFLFLFCFARLLWTRLTELSEFAISIAQKARASAINFHFCSIKSNRFYYYWCRCYYWRSML